MTEGIDGYIEQIKKHYVGAIEKHPVFCERITKSSQPVMRKIILDNIRGMAESNSVAEYILGEEIAEVFDAYDNENPKHAIYECYDAIAVLLRMVEKIENEMYPWEN